MQNYKSFRGFVTKTQLVRRLTPLGKADGCLRLWWKMDGKGE